MGNLASSVRLKRLPTDRWVWADTAGKETVGGYYKTQATESKITSIAGTDSDGLVVAVWGSVLRGGKVR